MNIHRTKWYLAIIAALLGGCVDDRWEPDTLRDGPDLEAIETTPAMLEQGRRSYVTYCLGCHGVEGDGNGPSARFMDPKPRDFRVGIIKFAQVEGGKRPRDADYLWVITHGLKGTAMPAFGLLPLDERLALITYLRTFPEEKIQKKAAGAMVPIPRDPFKKKPAKGVRQGERVYHGFASCQSCHPAYVTRGKIVEHMASYDNKFSKFRPHLYQSVEKASDWGGPILPPDFLYNAIKTGHDKEDIVRVVAAGVSGTAMPTWASTLTPKQLWGLAYYVEHIAKMRNSAEGDALRQQLADQPAFVPPKPPPPPPPPPPTDEDEGAGGGDPQANGAAGAPPTADDGASKP